MKDRVNSGRARRDGGTAARTNGTTHTKTDRRLARLAGLALATGTAAMAASCVVRADGAIATQAQGAMSVEFDVDRPGSDYSNFDLTAPSPESCRDACASDANCQAYSYVKPGRQGPNARCWLKNTVPTAVASDCCVSGAKGYAAPAPQAVAAPPPAVPAPPPAATTPVYAAPIRGTPPPPPPPSAATTPVYAAPIRGTPPPSPPPGRTSPGEAFDHGDHDRDHHGDSDRDWREGHDRHAGGRRMEERTNRPGNDFQNFDLARADPELCARSCWDNPTCQAYTFVRPGVHGPNARCWLKNSVPQAIPSDCCVSGVR